jgi:hypothetical protein
MILVMEFAVLQWHYGWGFTKPAGDSGKTVHFYFLEIKQRKPNIR